MVLYDRSGQTHRQMLRRNAGKSLLEIVTATLTGQPSSEIDVGCVVTALSLVMQEHWVLKRFALDHGRVPILVGNPGHFVLRRFSKKSTHAVS